MVILRTLIDTATPKTPILNAHYKDWMAEIKKRCQKQGLPYPPFVVIDRYHEVRGSNGLIVAIHHSDNDAMVYTQTSYAGLSENHLQPVGIDSFRKWLVTQRWDLANTTIMFIPIDGDVSFEPLWEKYLETVEKQKKILKALNSDDVLIHLEEARRLLQGKSSLDWGNAKAQARKALESLAINITGKSILKGLGRELKSRGLLGDREDEWIEKFDNLLGATYGLGSKKGGHKPDPTFPEARFYVAIASEVVDYVISLLLSET